MFNVRLAGDHLYGSPVWEMVFHLAVAGCLVVLVFSGLLRHLLSEEEMIDERKMSKQLTPAPTASAKGPRPTITLISRTPSTVCFTSNIAPPAFAGVVFDSDLFCAVLDERWD